MSLTPVQTPRDDRGTYHRAVMATEVLEFLQVGEGFYVDATVGGGGHSEMILKQLGQGVLLGIDLDREAIDFTRKELGNDPRLRLVQGSFRQLESIVGQSPEAANGISGILFDLGLSRHQAVSPERGFSYQADGALDMRFDPFSDRPTAQRLIARSSEVEIARIVKEFGEERFFRRISRRIHQMRHNIRTTGDLAQAVQCAVPSRFHAKALMRVFQAFRIAVNDELGNLEAGLRQAIRLLALSGRIVVLAYHSLEDRIVKQTFREFKEQGILRLLTRKPLRPTDEEVATNPSARSARLRAAVRIA